MATRVGAAQARARILYELRDGPLSAPEIAHRLWLEVMTTWAEANGVLWDEEGGTGLDRLRAHQWWEKTYPCPTLSMPHAVYPYLRTLEKQGEVQRIELAGHRPILWRIP